MPIEIVLAANPNWHLLGQSGKVGFDEGNACDAALRRIEEKAYFAAPGIKDADQ
jgi:hypothetical protein